MVESTGGETAGPEKADKSADAPEKVVAAISPEEDDGSRGKTQELSRRDRILNSAGRLFAQRGYGAVGINDIGGGAGISGPGVYRHFQNKESVLVALFDRLTRHLEESVDLAFKGGPMPRKALERLVKYHARLAIDEKDLILVYVKEQRNLPEPERSQALRRQRAYVDVWTDLLNKLRGDLSLEARRVTVHGAIWLLNSVGYHHTYLSEDDQVRILTRMANSALFA